MHGKLILPIESHEVKFEKWNFMEKIQLELN